MDHMFVYQKKPKNLKAVKTITKGNRKNSIFDFKQTFLKYNTKK